MLRVALAEFRAHLRRLVATALAVIFGSAFVTGTLVFAAAAQTGYYDQFARAAKNVDVVVEPAGAKNGTGTLSAQQLATVRGLPGVAQAQGRSVAGLAMLGANGRLIANFGRVGSAIDTDGDPALQDFDVRGRVPTSPSEAVLDLETAAHQRYGIGDEITVVDYTGVRQRLRLVGLVDFHTSLRYSGQSVVGLTAARLLELTGQTGLDAIVVRASAGVAADELASLVRAQLPTGATVRTGAQWRADLANSATQIATQFTTVLGIFAAIALVVATFVIYNTFAILLAQRIRATALLACIGASRRQIFGAVLIEASLLGLLSAAAGVGLGLVAALAMGKLFNDVLHAGVPVSTVALTPAAVFAGLSVGLLVTVCAALIPAIRATRTSPLAALRLQPTAPPASRRSQLLRVAAALTAAGIGAWLTAAGQGNADAQAGTYRVVAGGVAVFVAILIAAPLFIGPLIGALAVLPTRLFGAPARLAGANAQRSPGRTAITSTTLMIGVALITLFTVLIGSMRQTATRQIVGHYPVDYVLTGSRFGAGQQQAPIPAELVHELRQRPEFAAVAEIRVVQTTVDGLRILLGAIDPAALGSLVKPEMVTGSYADLGASTAIVSADRPRMSGYHLGSLLSVTSKGAQTTLRVIGASRSAIPGVREVDAIVSWSQLTDIAGSGADTTVMLKAAPGVTAVASRRALDAAAEPYPLVEIDSLADLSNQLNTAVNGLVTLVGGLLAIAILIALFGITNTLSLSVVERTRESATLRALGLTKSQLRASLLIEALLMGAVAAVVGIGFGLGYGRLVVLTAFKPIGPVVVVLWSWLGALVLVACAAAALAAVLPARRAAGVEIVAAVNDR